MSLAIPLPRRTILLVDDSASDRSLFKLNAQNHDCEIIEATSTEQALEILYLSPINLIVLDNAVPRQGGIAFTRVLKSDPSTSLIPVVMLAGPTDPAQITEAYDAGISCFIQKGDTLGESTLAVERCLEFWSTVAHVPGDGKAPFLVGGL